MLEILGKTNFDFMGKRRYAFLFSGIMVVLGIIALIQIARGAGQSRHRLCGRHGRAVEVRSGRSGSKKRRKALESNGLGDAELQEFGQENKLLIRVKASTTIEEKTAEKVVSIFTKEFPGNNFVVESSTEIGPTIGKKLQSDALVAIVISFAGIILYIAARFELRFGVAAALATFHDVLAVLGAFYHTRQGNHAAGRHGAVDPGGLFAHGHGRGLRPYPGKPASAASRARRDHDQ